MTQVYERRDPSEELFDDRRPPAEPSRTSAIETGTGGGRLPARRDSLEERRLRDVRMRGFAERADVEEVERFLAEHAHAARGRAGGAARLRGARARRGRAGRGRRARASRARRWTATRCAAKRPSAPRPTTRSRFEVAGRGAAGEPLRGRRSDPAQAVRIMTGAPIPEGADAVVMAEVCSEREGRVEVTEAVAPRKNVGAVGEDIRAGELVLRGGAPPAAPGRGAARVDRRRAAALRAAPARAARRHRRRAAARGQPARRAPRIVDSNSVVLRALVARDGGELLPFEILPDRPEAIREALWLRSAPTSCSSRAAAPWARRTTRRGSSPSSAASTSTASPCAPRARRGSGRIGGALRLPAARQPGELSVRLRVLRRADAARPRRALARLAAPARAAPAGAQDRLGGRPHRLRARRDRGRARRAPRDLGRLDPLVDGAGGGLRDRAARARGHAGGRRGRGAALRRRGGVAP